MQIIFETKHECESAEFIISDHESNKKRTKSIGIDDVISEMIKAINVFYIKGFDKIGVITCKFCKKDWVAICSSKSKTLACPSCKMHNHIQI